MAEHSFKLDTHVWVSIFHGKKAEKLIDAIIEEEILLITSNEQLKEFQHIHSVYPQIQDLLPNDVHGYLDFIKATCNVFPTKKRFALLSDYKDNYLVDLAWQTQSALVSDDKTFKPLKLLKRPKIKVISKSEFYKIAGWHKPQV